MIRYDPTLVDLASNFFVLCTHMKVYSYKYSWWVEIRVKGIGYCRIEIIKGLTDKEQFQYLTNLKGLKWGITCIQHNFFTKIKINILS